ncbi:hypothetical protein NUSPORA_01974 [Nucleospora cyclopteri]
MLLISSLLNFTICLMTNVNDLIEKDRREGKRIYVKIYLKNLEVSDNNTFKIKRNPAKPYKRKQRKPVKKPSVSLTDISLIPGDEYDEESLSDISETRSLVEEQSRTRLPYPNEPVQQTFFELCSDFTINYKQKKLRFIFSCDPEVDYQKILNENRFSIMHSSNPNDNGLHFDLLESKVSIKQLRTIVKITIECMIELKKDDLVAVKAKMINHPFLSIESDVFLYTGNSFTKKDMI